MKSLYNDTCKFMKINYININNINNYININNINLIRNLFFF